MDLAFKYVRDQGIETEDVYPYLAKKKKCKYDKTKVVWKIAGFTDVKSLDEDALAAAVAQQPVSVAIEADQDVFQSYTKGIIDSEDCGTDLDHGVLVVGYDTTGTQPFWIVKNSWSEKWGENGYVRIAKYPTKKGDPGICGIAMDPSYPKV